MDKRVDFPLDTLNALVAEREDLVSRMAAPLWSRVGRPLEASDLLWVRALLGEQGPEILIDALRELGALDVKTGALSARGLLHLLSFLLRNSDSTETTPTQPPELVWTLPYDHEARSVRGQTYVDTCIRLINEATESLTLVSPFVDPAGLGAVYSPLLEALSRGVGVRLLVHDALDIGTPTSRALEELRREAERMRTDLSVYSAEAGSGRDRLRNPLFHAKFLIRDRHALLLGSANLTSHALGSNFEAGVLLGRAAANEALHILEGVLRARTVYLVFRTKVCDRQ
jgi:phosphatidylserine/phosphatidylglycerophosphate/cardiolipin synthase-like enzyme